MNAKVKEKLIETGITTLGGIVTVVATTFVKKKMNAEETQPNETKEPNETTENEEATEEIVENTIKEVIETEEEN